MIAGPVLHLQNCDAVRFGQMGGHGCPGNPGANDDDIEVSAHGAHLSRALRGLQIFLACSSGDSAFAHGSVALVYQQRRTAMQSTAQFITTDFDSLRGIVRRRYVTVRILKRAAEAAVIIAGLAMLLAQLA